jgi:hypothetical protein
MLILLSFSPVVGIGTSPTPNPQTRMSPLVPEGGAHSLARKGVRVERVPIPNVCTLWYISNFWMFEQKRKY